MVNRDLDYIDMEINDDYTSDGIEIVDDEEDNVDLSDVFDATPTKPPKERKRINKSMGANIIQKPLTAKHRAKGIKQIIIQTNDGKIIKFC